MAILQINTRSVNIEIETFSHLMYSCPLVEQFLIEIFNYLITCGRGWISLEYQVKRILSLATESSIYIYIHIYIHILKCKFIMPVHQVLYLEDEILQNRANI